MFNEKRPKLKLEKSNLDYIIEYSTLCVLRSGEKAFTFSNPPFFHDIESLLYVLGVFFKMRCLRTGSIAF